MRTDSSWRIGSDTHNLFYQIYDHLRMLINLDLIAFFKKSLGSKYGGLILEAGSGPAFGSHQISKDRDVILSVALDHDINALREAKKRDQNFTAVVGDIYAMPFKTEAFDLVWNNSTFEHLSEGRLALSEMKRVARRGGYLYVGVPFRGGPFCFQALISKSKFGIWIGNVFSLKELEKLFSNIKMEIVGNYKDCLRLFIGVLARKNND